MASLPLKLKLRLAVCAFFADEIGAVLADRSDIEVVPTHGACDDRHLNNPLPLGQIRQERIWSSEARPEGSRQDCLETLGRVRAFDLATALSCTADAFSPHPNPSPAGEGLSSALLQFEEASPPPTLPTLRLMGACSGLAACPATLASCFELLLSVGTVAKLLGRGAHLLTPAMVRAWPETPLHRDMTPEQLRGYYAESVRVWVVVDLGVAGLTEAEVAAFTAATGVPLETLATESDLLRAMLSNELLRWELQDSNARFTQQIAENQHRLADFTMAYDFIGRLMPYQGEQRIINDILELFTVLCAPRAVHLLLASSNGESQYFSQPTASGNLDALAQLLQRAESCGELATTQGFYFQILYNEQKVGVVAVENILHSERQRDYLDLALLLMPVLRVAISNARTYDKLCDTERALLASKEGLEQRVEERTTELMKEIAERKQIEEELLHAKEVAEQATRTKASFLANMSHEIRTPMNAILGLSELGADEPSPLVMQDYLGKINQAASSLLGIIDDILDFSKFDAGKLVLEQAPFDLDRVLAEVEQLLCLKAEAKGLKLNFIVMSDVPRRLVGDALRLRQILINLLSNAIKFTETGHIRIVVQRLASDEASVLLQISVTDSGIGMTPEQTVALFQPFSQADNSTTRKYGGTGLGLAITRQLVQAMGGVIACQSSPDAGSAFTFTVRLLLDNEPSAVAAPADDYTAVPGARILLVEDNSVNQLVAGALLKKAGMFVTLATDGEEAVRLLRQAPTGYDLVLMDIQMPKMDGYEATHIIREELGLIDLPIIAMTAHAMAEEKQHCLSSGMNDHIAKPFNQQALQQVLGKWLKKESVA